MENGSESLRQKPCGYFKYGYCRFGRNCLKPHITEECRDRKCSVRECERRHPRLCRYWRDYGRCKFEDNCAFRHEDETKRKTDEIVSKLNETTQKLVEKDMEIINLKEKISEIEKMVNYLREMVEAKFRETETSDQQ